MSVLFTAVRLILIQHHCAATRVSFFVVQGDHHERLSVTPNLCLTNGAVVSKIWAGLVIEFTHDVKVNDPREQPLCLLLVACLLFVPRCL